MNSSQFNFDHLRIDQKDIDKIHHNAEYIKQGNGPNAIRRIFYNAKFDNFELDKINELNAVLQKRRIALPQGWMDSTSLKYLYSVSFNTQDAASLIQDCLRWRNNPASSTITDQVRSIFENGIVYSHGRDKQLRPIFIIDLTKMNQLKVNENDFNAACTIMIDAMVDYCFVAGKIENAVVIVTCGDDANIQKLPLSFVKAWAPIGNSCYPEFIHKLLIVVPPKMNNSSLNAIEAFIARDTAAKVEIMDFRGMARLHLYISATQLEEKLGGTDANLTKYWPPGPEMAVGKPRSKPIVIVKDLKLGNMNQHLVGKDERFDFTERDEEGILANNPGTTARATTAGRIHVTNPDLNASPEQKKQETPKARATTNARVGFAPEDIGHISGGSHGGSQVGSRKASDSFRTEKKGLLGRSSDSKRQFLDQKHEDLVRNILNMPKQGRSSRVRESLLGTLNLNEEPPHTPPKEIKREVPKEEPKEEPKHAAKPEIKPEPIPEPVVEKPKEQPKEEVKTGPKIQESRKPVFMPEEEEEYYPNDVTESFLSLNDTNASLSAADQRFLDIIANEQRHIGRIQTSVQRPQKRKSEGKSFASTKANVDYIEDSMLNMTRNEKTKADDSFSERPSRPSKLTAEQRKMMPEEESEEEESVFCGLCVSKRKKKAKY